MKTLGYSNGEYGPLEQMRVPMNDRVCFFGDGVYEATTVENHIPYALDEHLQRMERSAAKLEIPLPMELQALRETLLEMTAKLDSGSSQWQALSGFVRYVGGFLPWFAADGTLQVCPMAGSGAHRSVDAAAAVTDCSVRFTRYGVISEMLVKDKTRQTSQRVVNQAFLDLGGSRRQVLYTPGVSTLAAMRYTGEYQIRRSMEGKRQVELTVAGAFAAQPGDVAWVTYDPLRLAGDYDVVEAESRGGSTGETTTLTLEARDHVDI